MKHYNGADNTSNILEAFSASARPTLTVDVAKYQEHLDGSDLTPEQKEEFLKAVWSIVVTFVELGYGVHPLQEACGKDGDRHDQGPQKTGDSLNSDDPTKPTY
ncbi:hypothetical protein [Rhodophyticola porphyridii]|uniref:hypothetical protein n=1 Tax=Rhodophyticola porphyridii TaxID=1852017 RepID=UPI0035D029F3